MGSIQRKSDDLYVTSGEHIFTINLKSEQSKHVTVPAMKIPKDKRTKSSKANESRNITSLGVSKCEKYIVVATEDKQVVVYNKSFEVIKSFTINRTASKIQFTQTNDILIADKSGDVYLYDNNSDLKGTLLMGHRSIILDLILSNCGKYVITCDRDEKIRVSSFPNCYNIVSYCLGHTEFVTRIKLLTNEILVSASGDGTIRFWCFTKGQEVNLIDTNQHIEEDKAMLEKFARRFENTEISALPISDMDIYVSDEAHIAVAIGGCDLIQLYKVNLLNLTYTFLTKFVFNEPFCFCLSDNLYILSKSVTALSYITANSQKLNLDILEKFSTQNEYFIKLTDNISLDLLYKRKHDNVQEYMERKKQRLEIKKLF